MVKRIFDEYVNQDRGIAAIVRGLTEDGAPLRNGSKWQEWSFSQVHRILTREAYKGKGWYGRQRHISTEYGRKHFPQPEDTWIAMPYPQLIDEATWECTQALRGERQSLSKRNTKSFYLLQHLLVCEECGLGFTARTSNGNTVHKNGRTYRYDYAKPIRYYKCRGMEVHHTGCREHPFIKAELVEELVWSEVAKVLKAPETIIKGLEARVEGDNSESLATEIAQAERELQNVQAEEDRAIRLHISGKITEAQLDRQRKFITERLERAQAKLEGLKSQQRAVQQRQSLAEGIVAWAKEVQVGLEALAPEERQKVLRLVLSNVSIDRKCSVRITLAIPAPEFMSIGSQRTSCW